LTLPDTLTPGLAAAAGALPGLAAALAAVVYALRTRAQRQAARASLEQLQDRVWELNESEQRYRNLVESQADLVLRRDITGRLTFVNDAYARLAGRSPADLLGTTFRLAAPSETAPDDDQPVPTPAGTRWYSWIESPARAPDGSPEIQAVGREVTARHEAEAALADALARAESASAAKSRFLAVVSHEIRTPLSAVLGMADLLTHTRLDAEQSTYVQAVKGSGEALLSLIEEILDFAKIEAGRLELAREAFDIHALVEGTVELMAPRAQGKGLDISCHIDRSIPREVLGDPSRVRQILMNLVGNAVKFTERGGVGVRLEPADTTGLEIIVEDTGIGIPADRIERIFEDFEQGADTHAERQDGTGLGLPISRRLAEGMGGRLSVASEPGRGSTFRVTLPLAAAGRRTPGAEPAQPSVGETVLIASDTPFESEYLARKLRDLGCVARVTRSSDEAVREIAAGRIDVLVADLSLGDDEARNLAVAACGAGVERRLLMMSPYQRRAFGPPATAGYTGYLTKPVRSRALPARLGQGTADQGPALHAPTRTAVPRRTSEGIRVLLAEDNEINAMLGRRQLERFGATVAWARHGMEAVERFEEALSSGCSFDFVVLDVRMPVLDGCGAAVRIRQIERSMGLSPVPMMALTANALEEDRQAVLASGMDGILTKPVDPARLGEWLARAQDLRQTA
jgi:signal transduction histidine kinase/CheY-like chemotaxis protein